MESIGSEQELQAITAEDKVVLESDIHIEDFTAIEVFNGVLDGNGYTIHNLNSALIEYIGEDGILKNISFENAELSSESDVDKFGIVRLNKGVVDSVTVNRSEVTKPEQKNLGMLVGYNKDGIVQNCQSYGTVEGGDDVGLLVGKSEDGTVENCSVSGEVHLNGSFMQDDIISSVGGIVGKADNSDVTDCCVQNTSIYGIGHAGGAIGSAIESEVRDITIEDTDIDSNFSGGIVGELIESDIVNSKSVNLKATSIDDCSGIAATTNGDCLIKQSSVSETVLQSYSDYAKISSINARCVPDPSSQTGTVIKSCFTKDVVIKTKDKYNVFCDNARVFSSYADEQVYTTQQIDPTNRFENENFYIDVDFTTIELSSEKVTVHEYEDLKDIEPYSDVELKEDITVTSDFTSIPALCGTFNGNGNTIYNLDTALFKCITRTGTVKNLTLSNITFLKETSYFMGILSRVNKGKVQNVDIKNVDITDNTFEGCMGLLLSVNSSEGSVINCSASGCIKTRKKTVGGLVGETYGDVCESEVDIDIQGKKFVGGIAGQQENSTNQINKCTSEGCLDGDVVGGIVGVSSAMPTDEIIVNNCESKCEIESSDKAGGIAGYNKSATVMNCVFKGEIVGIAGCGGIVGVNNDKVENSTNIGEINGGKEVGGVVGVNHNGTLVDSKNLGEINAECNVGGLVGKNEQSDVKLSINTGTVTGEENVGGLIGTIVTRKLQPVKIIKCCNDSEVYTDDEQSSPIVGSKIGSNNVTCESLFWVKHGNQDTEIGKEVKNASTVEIALKL